MIRFSSFQYKETQWSSLENLPFELPKLQAHRGYWVEGQPQNSLDSVFAAHSRGYRMVELDLRLSPQGRIVLSHDKPGSDFENLTTLQQLLDEAPSEMLFNLEIKNESKVNFLLEERIVQLLKNHPAACRVLFSSFNPFSLAWMAQLLPDIPRALLVTQSYVPGNSVLLRELSFLGLANPHFLNLRWEDLDHYREIPSERKVVWTLNDAESARTLFRNHKIRSVISDSILPLDLKGLP